MATQQKDFVFDEEITPEQSAAQAERDHVREEYRARLAEKLKDPEFRKIEGFPIGTDEAILALSDPPFYTACPNPFIEEWLVENGKPYDAATDTYHREPFAADVSEGKNDPIYNAHSYHTKVPHKAIMRYILHYTEPGDVVYDGFCGTGMTGVAAQMCGNKAQVESLGYRVEEDGTILDEIGMPFSKLGARKAILNDLSPAATFIAYNYNTPVDAKAFEREAKRILAEVEDECGWMYSTLHDASEAETARVANAVQACQSAEEMQALFAELKSGKSSHRDAVSKMQLGRINYMVWSDVFLCPNCGGEIVFWDAAVDEKAGKVREEFFCPSCRAGVSKRGCKCALISGFDEHLGKVTSTAKSVPVRVNGKANGVKFDRVSDAYDRSIVQKISEIKIPYWYPINRMPEGKEGRRNDALGMTHVCHFYTKRNLWSLSKLRSFGLMNWLPYSALTPRATKMHRIAVGRIGTVKQSKGGATVGATNNTLFVPSFGVETNVLDQAVERITTVTNAVGKRTQTSLISTDTSASQGRFHEVGDYIFTDPPFGGIQLYSELNALWEGWINISTNAYSEAVVSNTQNKGLLEYQNLMTDCFLANYRFLKRGRWMTLKFHNSENAVWNTVQEALSRAGFIVADTRILDNQQDSFIQSTTHGAVKKDLIVACYKPCSEFETRFRDLQGTPESATEFVRQHLSMLPVTPLSKNGKMEPVAERNRFLLFDRMIAYHLQKGAPIPLDAAPFYKMLEEQFTCRDEMYFLPEQAARFDALKLQGMETEQLSIFVQDEKTAVQWVRGALAETPQTLGELTPTFMQELRDWPAHEPRPELKDLLREYFIQNENGVWRVPNPDDEKDIEQLRKNALLRLFRDYTKAKGPLKVFRKEAIIQGFTTCYETSQYGVIVSVCEKIPEKIRDEIQEFVMFYDIAKSLAPPKIVQTEFVFE